MVNRASGSVYRQCAQCKRDNRLKNSAKVV